MSRAVVLLICTSFAWGEQPAERPNLLVNGSFEAGLAAWPADHAWYESPRGSGKGTSRFSVDAGAAREGKQSASVVGTDNRGIILQDVRIRPEGHRLSGWIRCEGLGDALAMINVEWLTAGAEYIGGTQGGSISGDTDWKFVSADLAPPENAGIARVECLTNTNNNGRAWFDDIRLVNAAAGDRTPPPAVPFGAEPSYWVSGAVNLAWQGYDPPEDLAQYWVYVGTESFRDVNALEPVQRVKGSGGGTLIGGLDSNTTYHLAVAPVDVYGNMPAGLQSRSVTPLEAGAPRVHITPLLGPTGALAIRLFPPLGRDRPTAYEVRTECGGKRQVWRCPAQGDDGRGLVVASGFAHRAEVRVEATVASDGDRTGLATALATTPSPADPGLPRRGDVSGVVVATDGSPISEAAVHLTGAHAPRQQVMTGVEGAFALKTPGARDPAAARLVASAPGYLSAYREIVTGVGAVRARLELAPREQASWELWTASPLAQVFQDDGPPSEASPQIKLTSARNERECYQIVVRSKAEVGPVRVLFEDLQLPGGKRALSADTFAAHFVNYVPVEKNSRATPADELVRPAPADFPDELSDDAERVLQPNVTQPIFLTFHVPSDAPPGTYTGNVYLRTPLGLDPVPVSLEVLPLTFPDQPRLWVVNWFSTGSFADRYGLEPYGSEWWAMLRHYAHLFREHHQNVVTVSPGLCQIWIEEDGSATYDWSRFDEWCELFLSEGMRRLNITHLGGRGPGGWEAPEFVLHDRPATVRATGTRTTVPVTNFAAELQQHLEEKGWLDLAYLHVADEPIPVNVESWKQQSDLIHAAAPGLKRMDAIQVPDLRGFCELWVPQLNYFDQWYERYNRWHGAGEFELWFYIAWVPQGKYPNRLIDTESIKPRVVHWMNYLYDARGYLHWGLNHWHLKLGQFSPGDEWIVWPGRQGPNSSLRYEAQRDGLEDCEYLYMLQDAQQEIIEKLGARGFDARQRSAEIGRRIVRSMTDYTRSYEELQAAREEIAREIVAARHAPLVLVSTEPTTAAPIPPSEVNVWGVTEPECQVTVNGKPASMDGDRFLVRADVTAESPDVTVVVRKAKAEKRIVRHFRISQAAEPGDDGGGA